MAFLHHHPRRSARVQLSNSPSNTSLSQSTQSIQQGSASLYADRENKSDAKDWSIVFPGRAKAAATTTSTPSPTSAEYTTSPFVSSPDDEVDESNVELALPNEQDGTGRFTRPSSPFYAADDEEEEGDLEEIGEAEVTRSTQLLGPSTVDSISEDESEFEGLEIASSAFLSGSELGRRDSSVSHGQRRLSEWERGADGPSSSWSWMNAEGSQRSHHIGRGGPRSNRNQSTLPVVFTSGSEGEEEAAFEDALANTHSAQSAGLSARVPKRRHRKNGESAKGSKRSNSSAVVASDLRASRRRAGFGTRKSATSSFSARDASRARAAAELSSRKEATTTPDAHKDSRVQRLLDVVLRKLFSVEDDEVLQAFLRDEGPLKVEEEPLSSLAVDASVALSVASKDEVWHRNERSRKLRRSHHLQEEEAEEQQDSEEQDDGLPRELVRLPPRGMDSSQMLGSPPVRIRLASHVGEPTLLEALQATVFSSMAVVPSGLSILLAGSRSIRLAQYLAGRIGPSLTERVRKLIDDAEDDTSIPDELVGFESSSSVTRFRGGSHPAISSRSSTTLTSSRAEHDTRSYTS